MCEKSLSNEIKEAAEYILQNCAFRPKMAVILGSGLGDYGDSLKEAQYIDYRNIPHFPVSTVQSHKGRFAVNEKVLCMQGRFHYYEGYSMEEVTFPIRVMKETGIETLLVTNASGGVNKGFSCGDFMVIKDHINFMGANPLRGKNMDDFGPRFPDMSNAYDRKLREEIEKTAHNLGIALKTGVYMAFSGPSFETPAEIKMARAMGADAVGMSTVPEVIIANHCGMKVMGISLITNMASGVTGEPLSHEEVMETGERVKPVFMKLVEALVEKQYGK